MALCWTIAVAMVSYGVYGYGQGENPMNAEGALSVHTLLTQEGLSARNIVLLGLAISVWWLGFVWLTTPILRSSAVDIARDESETRVCPPRICNIAALSVPSALIVPALVFAPILLVGLLGHLDGTAGMVGNFFGGLVAVLLAVPCAAMLIIIAASAPLMAPASAVEAHDIFESASRSVAFVMQEPLRYAWNWLGKILVMLLSALLGATVLAVAWGLVALAFWIVGASDTIVAMWDYSVMFRDVAANLENPALALGAVFWGSVVALFAWLMVVGLNADLINYMLMRYHVDGATMDEITMPEDIMKLRRKDTASKVMAEADQASESKDENSSKASSDKPEPETEKQRD